ncbi:MAG: IS66 family transposase, partial [Magnetococcales bacterium]|nr:IS66 family transposase [Magnetococcales bacterium]
MNAPLETPPPDLPEDPTLLREMVLTLQDRERYLLDQERYWKRQAGWFQEQMNLLLAKRFGRSSEKSPPEDRQPGLFDEAEEIEETAPDAADEEERGEESTTVTGHERRKPGRKPLPEWLPREEVIYDLPETERTCDVDGSILVEIGRESSEQLDIIPARVRVIRHVRIKYGCPHCHQGVKTAPVPPRPIPKALATAALLAHVVVGKYADGLPLYRQGDILTRAGIDLSRSTLANWMIQAGTLVQPLINLMRDHLLDYGVIQMDETTVQVLKETGKLATSTSYMWVRRGSPLGGEVILFDYDPSRRGAVAKGLLSG